MSDEFFILEDKRPRHTPETLPMNARLYMLERNDAGQRCGYIHNLYLTRDDAVSGYDRRHAADRPGYGIPAVSIDGHDAPHICRQAAAGCGTGSVVPGVDKRRTQIPGPVLGAGIVSARQGPARRVLHPRPTAPAQQLAGRNDLARGAQALFSQCAGVVSFNRGHCAAV